MQIKHVLVLSVVIFLALLIIPSTHGRPYRQKRVSDQRLAELETIMALRNLAGKLVTVPVGFGQVDPGKVGRRRRRSAELLLQELLNSPTREEPMDTELFLPDNNETDEDVRDLVGSHRPPQQWLNEWSRRIQV